MFSKDERAKIRVAYNMYNDLLKNGVSNAVAKKTAENIIKDGLSDIIDQNLVEYIIRLFFSRYEVLDLLVNSDLCNPSIIRTCSNSKNLDVPISDIKKVLLLKFNDSKTISLWLSGDSLTRQAIEKYNANDTMLEAIQIFNKAGIECSGYISRYKNPLELKRVATILSRDSSFDVDLYNRYQLEAIAKYATNKKLLSAINPDFLADTITLVCKLIKQDHNTKDVLNVVAKYNDLKIVSNYFAVKDIMNKTESKRSKSLKIAKLIDSTMISLIANCEVDDDIPNQIMRYYSIYRTNVDAMDALDRAIEKVETYFPFMLGIILQLKDIYPRLSVLHDAMLDEKSRAKEEAKKQKLEAKYNEMLDRELPMARVSVESYVMACNEDKMLSAKQFCANNGIDNTLFTKHVNLIKEHDKELYDKYHKISVSNQARAMAVLETAAKQVTKALAEKKGKFTLYDYYSITKFDMSVIHNTISRDPDNFTYSELLRFRNFWEKYRYETPMKPAWFYNDYMKIRGREITKEDKDKILKFMGRMRYPLIIPIYKEIVRKYVDGTLEIY